MKKRLAGLATGMVAAVFQILAGSAVAQSADQLAGSEWGYSGRDIPFVRFDEDGRVSGNAGCNRFFGSFEIRNGGVIEFGAIGATRMMCPKDAMDTERAFLDGLAQSVSYERDGARLVLHDADGVELLALVQRDRD